MTSLLEEQYIEKAKKAYNDDNLKLCLVYFKKVTNWSLDLITLLVEGAYRLWKYNVAHNNEENETIEIVRQAFTQLLSGEVPYEFIQSYDYIRLSHIYLVEGNLIGALQILNLASERGHLEDSLTVVQTWTIIKRLAMKKREVTNRINFLVTAVTLLAAETKIGGLTEVIYVANSPMPLSYLYMHCTNHLYQLTKLRPKSLVQQKQRKQQYTAMLMEAYYLSYGVKENNLNLITTWFFDPEVWFEMGKQLENTPFILFVEDCYWEAFLREPLANKAIEEQVKSMIKYHRRDVVPQLLREAMMINPWNTYCRDSLIQWEIELQPEPSLREWTNLFISELKELAKIQGHVRGWYLRKHWPEKSVYFKQRRAEFVRKMYLSYEYYELAMNRYYQSLLKKWKIYIEDWKTLKFLSSRKIQSNFRRFSKQKRYSQALARVYYANTQYINAIVMFRRFNRLHVLHHWYHRFNEAKKIRAIQVISDVLFLNGYNQLLVKGMNFITTIVRLHRRYERKRLFQFWIFRYQHRRRVKNMNTIRFWIRYLIRRREELKIEGQLKQIEAVIAQKLEVEYQRNKSNILKPFWVQWRKALLFQLRMKKVLNAVSSIQRKFFEKKAIKKVHELYLRKENQNALIKYRNHQLLLSILHPWRFNGAAFRITRFLHHSIAWKKYKRLFTIAQEVKRMKYQRDLTIKEKIWKRIEKYIFLWKRIRLRAMKRLQQFFRFCLFKKKLRKLIQRKVFYYYLIWRYHHLFSQKWLNYLQFRTIFKCQILSIGKLNETFRKYLLKNRINQWNHQLYQQRIMEQMIRKRLLEKFNQRFWMKSYCSVKILKEVSFTNMNEYQQKKAHGGRGEFSLKNTFPISQTPNQGRASLNSASPAKIITSRGNNRFTSSSSSSRVPSPSSRIYSPSSPLHRPTSPSSALTIDSPRFEDNHIDIFTVELAPWEEYLSKQKILYSLSTMRQMKYFYYWIIQYRLKTRQIRLQSLLFSYQFQEYILYRLYKRKQFIITLQSFFRHERNN